MAAYRFTDVTGQRQAEVTPSEAHGTVGEVLADAVRELGLPAQSMRGVDLDYTVRTADGSLLRPSQSLSDERVGKLLGEGDNTAVPRLTAAVA
jgi:hypothetical protein